MFSQVKILKPLKNAQWFGYILAMVWSTTHTVLKSYRSKKVGVTYMQSWKQCAIPVITRMTLWQLMHLGTWCMVVCRWCGYMLHTWYMVRHIMCARTWVATKPLWWYPGGHIVFMIALFSILIGKLHFLCSDPSFFCAM